MSESSERQPIAGGGVPDFLTVEEAALVLRLGRSAAYREVRRFISSGGAAGIPVLRFGKLLRVPRYRLEEQLGGPITWPLPTRVDMSPTAAPAASTASLPAPSAAVIATATSRSRRRSPRSNDGSSRLFSV
jgi:hypothetical protein